MSDFEEDEEFGEEEEEDVFDDEDAAAGESQEDEEAEEEEEDEDKIKEEDEEKIEEEEIEPRPLTEELLRDTLSLLTRIGLGFSHAYVKLDIHGRDLTNIDLLKTFVHLRFVNLASNQLRDISSLSNLNNLVTLRLDSNLLTSARLDPLPYLQKVSFDDNKIRTVEGIAHPLLEKLTLANNEITSLEGMDASRLGRLHSLSLRANSLTSTAGVYPPSLCELYLPGNMITTIQDLSSLPRLTVLHLRDNQIKSLDGFSAEMGALQYVNLRGNSIESFDEVKKVHCLPQLRALVLLENPIHEEDNYRLEVLLAFNLDMKLERLDKEAFNEDELDEASDLAVQRQEEQRLAAEEAGLNSEDTQSSWN